LNAIHVDGAIEHISRGILLRRTGLVGKSMKSPKFRPANFPREVWVGRRFTNAEHGIALRE